MKLDEEQKETGPSRKQRPRQGAAVSRVPRVLFAQLMAKTPRNIYKFT
jgi:hypothetical protein